MYWYHTKKQTGGTMTLWSNARTIGGIKDMLTAQAKCWPKDFEDDVLVRVVKGKPKFNQKTHAYYIFRDNTLVKQDYTDLSHWLDM